MHMLRHSFAAHLLEKCRDVVFIQKLLGHNDLRTTLCYLHVTNKDLVNILSPLKILKIFYDNLKKARCIVETLMGRLKFCINISNKLEIRPTILS